MGLEDLPTEVQKLIYENLSIGELSRMTLVSKQVADAAQDFLNACVELQQDSKALSSKSDALLNAVKRGVKYGSWGKFGDTFEKEFDNYKKALLQLERHLAELPNGVKQDKSVQESIRLAEKAQMNWTYIDSIYSKWEKDQKK